MKVLVTGGAGYIGSHTCLELIRSGHDVVVLDNLCNSDREVVDALRSLTGHAVPFYETDLLERGGLERIFSEHSFDCVLHFAGLKAVGESVEKPLSYYHNNLTGTINLCEVMAAHGVKSMVFSSSATVYGITNPIPFTEDMPLSAINPYGRTKLFIEQMLRDLFTADSGWSIVLLRYFNPLGADESGLLGENPRGIPGNLMPYILRVATGELPKLTVFGGDYPTPDGTGVRDYIHVTDLARGHIAAMEKLTTPGVYTYNLGTGRGYSVLEVIRIFEEVSGAKVPYEIGPRRPGDIPACWADVSKARRELGFEAKLDLRRMCADSWRYTVKRRGGTVSPR